MRLLQFASIIAWCLLLSGCVENGPPSASAPVYVTDIPGVGALSVMEVRPYGLNNNTVDRVYFIDKTQPMTAVIQRHKAPSTSVVIIDGKEYILKPTEPAPTTLKP